MEDTEVKLILRVCDCVTKLKMLHDDKDYEINIKHNNNDYSSTQHISNMDGYINPWPYHVLTMASLDPEQWIFYHRGLIPYTDDNRIKLVEKCKNFINGGDLQ